MQGGKFALFKQKFDVEKAIEVLLYITSRRISEAYTSLKIVYFADKEHLMRYGRLICGDTYIAMNHGAVPSGTYDIVKIARGDSSFKLDLDFDLQEVFKIDGNSITPLREPNLDYLSKSDIECLESAIATYGSMTFQQLKDRSHDKAYESADINDVIPVEEIIKTLPNSESLLEYYELD